MIKPMMKRIITAGPLVQVSVYPVVSTRDSSSVRQGKKALSSRAQQRMNAIYAWQKLKLLLAANFGPGDIFATLTYRDGCLPESRKAVLRDVKAFIGRLRKARGKTDLHYIYVVEHKHGDTRWHVHLVLNSTGSDYELVRRLWGKGEAEFRKLRVDREKNYETLARYLCKEERDKPGDRLWSGSRNLRKPQRDSFRVPDGEPLRRPPGRKALVLAEETVITAYGTYRYLEYISLQGIPRPERGRRRKKK